MTRGRSKGADAFEFDAFVSYSHAADGKLAPALQAGLERICKPWYRLKSLRIFRDRTNLALNPDLWGSIQRSLSRSRWLLYMASPEASGSRWIGMELKWWLEHRDPNRILLVLTSGELVWRADPGGFDPERSTALHRALEGAFQKEPLWLDLRWARDPAQLTDRHIRFRSALVAVAAALRDVEPAALDSESVTVLRRNRRWAASAVTALALATVWSLAERYRVMTARISSEAQVLARRQPTEALLLLSELKHRWFADDCLLSVVSQELLSQPLTIRRHIVGDAVGEVAWSRAGMYAAAASDGDGHVWSADGRLLARLPARPAETRREIEGFGSGVVPLASIAFTPDGSHLITTDWPGCARIFPLEPTLPPSPEFLHAARTCLNPTEDGEHYPPWAASPSWMLAVARATRIDFPGNARRSVPIPPEHGAVEEMRFDAAGWLYFRSSLGRLHLVPPDGTSTLDTGREVTEMGACTDGSTWALVPDGQFLSLRSGRITDHRLAGAIRWLISPSCRHYIDDSGDLYRLGDGAEAVLRGIAPNWPESGVSVAFSHDEQSVAVSSHDGAIRVTELRSGASVDLLGHSQRVFSLAFGPDDRKILSGSFDGAARVFDLDATAATFGGRFEGAEAVYMTEDGRPVVSTQPFVPGLPEDRPLAVPELLPSGESVDGVTVREDWRFSDQYVLADGDTLFVGICSDPRCPTESVLREFRLDMRSSGSNVGARVTADGRILGVVEADAELNVWDTRRGTDRPVFTLRDSELTSATVSASGDMLYTLSGGKLVAWPVGAASLAEEMREKVSFCLSPSERQAYLDEPAWLAGWNAASCN